MTYLRYYLSSVAQRCSDSEERKRLRELSTFIFDQAKARDGPQGGIGGEGRIVP